jgi:tryptophan halogenase
MKTNSITIVGGGSAGWMTAAILIKAFPHKEISLIESPNFPIVGVGESTIGGIRTFTSYLEIDEKDFLEFTDGSYKLSIKFTDFYKKDYGSFHYPFGVPCFDDTTKTVNDWMIKKGLYPDTPIEDFVKCYFPHSALYENNKFALNNYGIYDSYAPHNDVAYHFDATKFGLWLKERYCLPRGVKHSFGEVVSANISEVGIKSLIMADGSEVSSDLFIDCTGFKSLLLGEFLKEPFESFNHMLPNNRAWATRLPYKDKDKEMEPFTNSTAIATGWVWNIPLWSRIGTGYVYSDKYATPEEALEQFKEHLCSDKMLFKRTKEEVDALEFKDVRMRVGMHERIWVKNVVAIGLSAGFIEPLESNGLYSVHEFLFKLLKSLLRDDVSQWDIDVFNAATKGIFRNFAEFVALHYALSHRDDSPYWVANNNRVYSPEMVKGDPVPYVGFTHLQDLKMFRYNVVGNAGINYISTGMNYFISDTIDQINDENFRQIDYKKFMEPILLHLDERKERWEKAAKNELSLYEYLKKNIYKV